jgi:hypothetical protein
MMAPFITLILTAHESLTCANRFGTAVERHHRRIASAVAAVLAPSEGFDDPFC